jgi:hypothetical protein
MRRLLMACLAAVVASGYSLAMGSANTTVSDLPDPKTVAKQILASEAGHLMSGNARMVLEMMARGDQQLSQVSESQTSSAARAAAGTKLAQGGDGPGDSSFSNVRVNNPSEDLHQTDQTTQSETSIAAVGKNVAVGFNDSQHSLLSLTAGTNFNGVSYSQDGGATFTDGGVVPNHPGCVNLGDPWLTSDRSGAMYYSSLERCETPIRFALDIGVSKSTDGGKTWSQPVDVSASIQAFTYMADKDAMTTGRDPFSASKDVIYDTWDDFSFDPFLGPINGLPVAHSNDGGATWSIVYADRVPLAAPCPDPNFSSFAQYIGAVPIVDSAGTLYVAAEKISQACPAAAAAGGGGGGKPPMMVRNIVVFASTDGGKSFGPANTVAQIVPAAPPFDMFNLGDGIFMRNLEFPTVALHGSDLYAAWNDGGAGGPGAGHSHIRLAKSSDGGVTWSDRFITGGTNDQMQPAMSGDASGLHILYYQRNPDNTLDVKVSNSQDGQAFSSQRVTTRSFPGVLNFPQFDPIIAPFYMGDYIANISNGSGQLFAWGDNRDKVRDFLFTDGRSDPNVYFATQGGEGGQNG